MKYRREIDGLRAVAVLPVILFHAGFSVFSGGYIGVDVFFVISGYLITSILISELEEERFSIARFYERRARRILPALFTVMLACLPFAYMWMLPLQLKDFAQSLVAVVFFGSNILFWRESGYFAADAELKPLLHTWSLAVEEQYYLLFPIFLLLAWRFGRNKVFWSVVVIAAISLLLAEWGWRNKPSANFYLATTRAWELLAGSICAFLTVGRTLKSNSVLSAIGLAAIVFAIFVFDDNTPFPSIYALVPVVGTALIILFGRQGTWVAKLLSMSGFVGIGLISYSAYLWHQPLFAFARLRSLTEPSNYLMAALAVASLLLAWATWYWVEQPFRKRKSPILVTRRSVFVASGTVGAVFVAIGLAGHIGKGFEWRFNAPDFVMQGEFALPLRENGFCFYSFNDVDNLAIGSAGLDCYLANGGGASVLLFGDSFAAHWEPFWKNAALEYDMTLHSVTTNWCIPAFSGAFTGPETSRAKDQCEYNQRWLRQTFNSYDAIVLAGMWEAVEGQNLGSSVFDLVDTILRESEVKIIIMGSPLPLQRQRVEDATWGIDGNLNVELERLRNIDIFETSVKQQYATNNRVFFLDQKSLFGDYFESKGVLTVDGFPYSLDGGHISIYGSASAWQHVASHAEDQSVFQSLAN